MEYGNFFGANTQEEICKPMHIFKKIYLDFHFNNVKFFLRKFNI